MAKKTPKQLEQELRRALNVIVSQDPDIDQKELTERAIMIAPNMVIGWDLTDHDAARIAQEVGEENRVSLETTGEIRAADFQEWLEERKEQEGFELDHWNAYRGLLEASGRSNKVIRHLDQQTDRIVELMGDPKAEGTWSRKGLAIGEVQSGKTATYAGALNKAIDFGYRIIVVIGGHTEDLRRQTQERLDSDLIGIDTSHAYRPEAATSSHKIGVGKALHRNYTMSLTSARSDFNRNTSLATHMNLDLQTPSVFVVKKNQTILNQLAAYLRRHGEGEPLHAPMIVIDDESDWASVNTGTREVRTAVNKSIINVLSTSTKSSYLGVTATPFANVLIDHEASEDLFPRDYIVSLTSPAEYCGVDYYFRPGGKGNSNIVCDVEDFDEMLPRKHKKSARIESLPDSLSDSILTFFVASAERRRRAQGVVPVSMMINASRFKDVQANISDLVRDHIESLSNQIIAEGGFLGDETRATSLGRELNRIRDAYLPQVDIDDIREDLVQVAETVEVSLVNGDTKRDREDRLSGLTRTQLAERKNTPTIYVGGDVLARGITLDGLIVSYFPRAAGAADTLLQMGRWFGYRPGYEDLTRIWMASDVVDFFEYTASISAELRFDVTVMGELNRRPEEFGLKIERHPESFRITAGNKSQSATEMETYGSFSFRGEAFETHALDGTPSGNIANLQAVDRLFTAMEADPRVSVARTARRRGGNPSFIWDGVPHDLVADLLSSFRNPQGGSYAAVMGLGENEMPPGLSELGRELGWTVVAVSGSSSSAFELVSGDDRKVHGSVRDKAFTTPGEPSTIQLGNRRVAAGNDFWNILSDDEQTKLMQRLRDERPQNQTLKETTSATQREVIRRGLTTPTLLIYSLVAETEPIHSNAAKHAERVPAFPVMQDLGRVPALVMATPPASEAEEHDAFVSGEDAKTRRFLVNTVYALEAANRIADLDEGDDE